MKSPTNHIGIWKYVALAALATLLLMYLINVYQKESNFLNKEARYLFVNTLDDVRGDVLEGLLKDYKSESKDDSVSVRSIVKRREFGQEQETRIFIEVRSDNDSITDTDEDVERRKIIAESIGGYSNEVDSGVQKPDSLSWIIANKFGRKLSEAGVDIEYRISSSDTVIQFEDLSSLDLDHQFNFEMRQSRWKVILKMWPEILFAMIVFALIVWAFFALEKAYKEQLRINEVQEQFVQNITHELKSPVAAISVAMEAIEKFNVTDPDQRKEYITNSRKELVRLDQMINQVMKSSMLGISNSYALESKSLDLSKINDELVDRLITAFPNHSIEVEVDQFYSGNWITNEEYYRAILYNILENAVKYNDKDKVEILIISNETEKGLSIQIHDNGPGVGVDEVKYIFDRFYRGQKGSRYDQSGYGLGLSLAREYATAMGGDLIYINNEKEGSTFQFLLPRKYIRN